MKAVEIGLAALIAVACSSSGDVPTHPGASGGGTGGAGGRSPDAGAGGAVNAGASGIGGGGAGVNAGSGAAGASAGAGEAGAGDEGGLAGASGGDAPALTITAVNTYVTDGETVTRTMDLTVSDLALFIYDPAAGTFTSHLPSRADASQLEYDTLPPGDRYVRYTVSGALSYFVTTASNLDLGRTTLGRPDVIAAPVNTSLMLSATALEAWKTGDALELFSGGAGVYDTLLGDQVSADATLLSGVTSSPSNLIDGQKGDLAFLTQLTPKPLPNVGTYYSLDRAVAVPSFSMTGGQPTSVSAAFTTPAQESIDVDWKASQFTSAAPSVTSESDLNGVFQPHPELGTFGFSPHVFAAFQTPAGPLSDFAPTFSYGNPFPAAWSLVLQNDVSFSVPIQLPGAQAATFRLMSSAYVVPNSALVQIKPLVGSVSNVQIGGKSVPFVAAGAAVSGVGLTPTVGFDAPTLGTATDFTVVAYRVTMSSTGNTTWAAQPALFFTGHTVTIPPGVLVTGNTYFLKINARLQTGIDRNAHPLATAYPSGNANWLSGFFTP